MPIESPLRGLDRPPLKELFLFAHQDDEFAVLAHIETALKRGSKVVCAFFTDGGTHYATPAQRNLESLRVLQGLSVALEDIHFLGDILSIGDQELPAKRTFARDWIKAQLSGSEQWGTIYVPAWEGGHPDHDALHATVVEVAFEKRCEALIRQFPLYNGRGLPAPWFRLLSPLQGNGTVMQLRLSAMQRVRFLAACLRYRSQWRSWIGLWPFLWLHYLVYGVEYTQPVSQDRLTQRPHAGPLLYERDGRASFEQLSRQLRS